jgi:hypothetical protein
MEGVRWYRFSGHQRISRTCIIVFLPSYGIGLEIVQTVTAIARVGGARVLPAKLIYDWRILSRSLTDFLSVIGSPYVVS